MTAPTVNNWATNSTRSIAVRYYLPDYGSVPVAPHYGDITGPFTYTDSAGTSHTIDMLNTGLVDQYGRRLASNRNNTLLKSAPTSIAITLYPK